MHTFGTKGRKQRNLIYIPVLSFTDVLSLSQITKIVKNVFKIFIVKKQICKCLRFYSNHTCLLQIRAFSFFYWSCLIFWICSRIRNMFMEIFFLYKKWYLFSFFSPKKPCGRQTFALFCM